MSAPAEGRGLGGAAPTLSRSTSNFNLAPAQEAAARGQSGAPVEGEEVLLHYVAFVNLKGACEGPRGWARLPRSRIERMFVVTIVERKA